MQPVHPDHVIDISEFFEVLAQGVHRLGELGTFLFNFSSRFDDLLVEDLIAVSEVVHARAKHHRILVHIDTDLALFSHQFNDRLAVLGFLEDFVSLLELLQILDLQEVIETDGRF